MATSELAARLLEANAAYAAKAPPEQLKLAVPPTEKLAILTCMDARLDPLGILGLAPGAAHVLRTAGGRVRASVVAQLVLSARALGTTDWIVMHHTDCAAVSISDAQLDAMVATGELPAKERIDLSDPQALAPAVIEDVRALREHEGVPSSVGIHGFVYDVRTARVHEIEEASKLGRAS